jgi:putative oxidoreductase
MLPDSSTGSTVRNVLFGGAAMTPTADAGRLVLRVTAGLALAMWHGLGKVPPSARFITHVGDIGLPLPDLFAWLAGFAELGGGLLLALGLLTRPAAFLMVGHFVIVVVMAHAGDAIAVRENALIFGAIAFFYMLAGAGRYSLDGLWTRRRG